MKNDILIKKTEMDCPICNEHHIIEQRRRHAQSLVNGEVVDFEEIYFFCTLCDDEENEFVSAGVMDQNLLSARDAYRSKRKDY
jgi:hypothetical protein